MRTSDTYTYSSWEAMRQRCNSPNCPDFPSYGGKGVSICVRWDSYARFLADMGERPQGTTIDRRDRSGNYTPLNCRWATPTEQAHNRSTTILVTYRGVTRSKSQWARAYGLHPSVFTMRLNNGWPMRKALTAPVKGSMKGVA